MSIKKTIKHNIKHTLRWFLRTQVVLWLIGFIAYIYTWLVGKTGKFEVHGQEEFEDLIKNNEGGIFVAWHGRALMLPFFWRNTRQMKALVSPHHDGRIIANMLKNYHILSIDGSSDREATHAALEITKELDKGTVVSLISDGPRGPRMRLNKSVIYFAQKSGKPIMGFTYSSKQAKVLNKSWDAMLIPKLFKKGIVLGPKPMFVPERATKEEMEALRQQLEDELNNLTLRADQKCGIAEVKPAEKHTGRYSRT